MARIAARERDAFYEARRSELAEVALRLWSEQGFDQTSVAAICAEAGVAKGTFYLYFESKDALLEDVMRRNSLAPQIQALMEDLRGDSLEEAVRGFVAGAWRHLSDHRELILVALRELPTHVPQVERLLERVVLPANQLLADYLERHIDPARTDQISLVVAARSLIGMILVMFISQEILGAGRFLALSEEQVTSTLAELFLRGVTIVAPESPRPC